MLKTYLDIERSREIRQWARVLAPIVIFGTCTAIAFKDQIVDKFKKVKNKFTRKKDIKVEIKG